MADLITVAEATSWIGRDLADPVDTDALTTVVAAVNAHIAKTYRKAVVEPIDADVKLAALLLTSREYARRNSPDGIVGFGDMGGVTIRSVDPDVRDLLKPFKSRTVG
jgi:hypothetical protein